MTRNIGLLAQISYILCQLLVCSGKSQLSNYVNVHCFQISIWTWLMSYHVETTLCHDIMTYDISWQPYIVPTSFTANSCPMLVSLYQRHICDSPRYKLFACILSTSQSLMRYSGELLLSAGFIHDV